MNASILIVDDQESVRHFFQSFLEGEGHTIHVAEDAAGAIEQHRSHDPDLILLDLNLPDASGIEVLRDIRKSRSESIVIMITASSDISAAVEAMRLGAFDYLPKPVDLDHLLLVVNRALKTRKDADVLKHLRRIQSREYGVDIIMSEKSPVRPIIDMVRQVAESDSTSVLIEGESGTGKELIAYILHQFSGRASGPMLDINCASLPEELLESELFGHEKGAYTDAHTQKKGLLELADGGTLFLDEVGEMSLTIQVKLLRVLEKMVFRRVGGVRDITVKVRIVSATNRDLMEEVRCKRFREDLYYRLKVVPITLPPLRDRQDDIPLLAAHFLDKFSGQFRKEFQGFTPEAHEMLLQYPWPGNIREMRNLLERTVLLGKGGWIGVDELGLTSGTSAGDDSLAEKVALALDGQIPLDGFPIEEVLSQIECEIIRLASEKTSWNQTRTAKLLKMNRDKLRYRMKHYKFESEHAHNY